MEIFYAAATFFLFFHRRLKIPDKHHYFVFAAIYTFESKVQVTINRWPRMVLHPILACAFCCLLNHYDLVWWSFMIIWIPIIVNFATYSIKVNESTLTQLFDRHQLSKPQRENLLFSDRFKRMTSEQYSIVNHDVHDDDVVKINAFAGTGKQYLTNGWYSNWFSLAMIVIDFRSLWEYTCLVFWFHLWRENYDVDCLHRSTTAAEIPLLGLQQIYSNGCRG